MINTTHTLVTTITFGGVVSFHVFTHELPENCSHQLYNICVH